MSTNYVFVHQVIARRLPGSQGGWEFICGRCSYRAVVFTDPATGVETFQLTDPGSPQASHPNPGQPPPVTQYLMRVEKIQNPPEPAAPRIALPGSDWLPPHLVRQIETILRRLGGEGN